MRRMNKEIKPPIDSEDAEDLFTYLPSEIKIDILLRLPNETIMRCMFVCKAWRDLLETRDFVQSHFSKSVPGLAVFVRGKNSKRYRIVEFVDEHRLNIVFSVDLPFVSYNYIEHSSANGLLFVCNQHDNRRDVSFVCNPITREYIRLPPPLEASSINAIYGFGVSKISGEYKVVRISLQAVDCQVYTVGTGSWRRVEFDDQLRYKGHTAGALFNGNLHWVAYNKDSSYHHDLICCFDLETERFSTFSSPPPRRRNYYNYRIMSVLRDYLCVCDTFVESRVRDTEIWLMKEYGDEKSWTKEFHFDSGYGCGFHCPIKVFEDGDILMEWGCTRLLYYSKKHGHETIQEVDLFNSDRCCATIYAPSFLRLKTFAMENSEVSCAEAFSVMHSMEKEEGIIPDIITYTTLIQGLCNGGNVREANDLLDELPSKGLQPDVKTYTILIGALCREGQIDEAKDLLLRMVKNGCLPNRVTYNVFLKGHLLEEMISKGFTPTASTFSIMIQTVEKEGIDSVLFDELKELNPI